MNERKQSALSKSNAQSSKHFKTTSTFLYSIYPQRAGKTSLFHMRAADITCFNALPCFIFKNLSYSYNCQNLSYSLEVLFGSQRPIACSVSAIVAQNFTFI